MRRTSCSSAIYDVFDHIPHGHGVERCRIELKLAQRSQADIQVQVLMGIARAKLGYLATQHLPALTSCQVQEKAGGAAHVEQVAFVRNRLDRLQPLAKRDPDVLLIRKVVVVAEKL
jgi:hypothetical protein